MATSLSPRRRFIAVLAGGFLGALARYLLSGGIQAELGKGWPYYILLINITGAFLLAFATVLADATFLVGPTRRLFINVGFLGAYTTFSSLALGDLLLFTKEQWFPALLYLILSIVGGVVAVLLGDWLGQWFVNRARRLTTQKKEARKKSGLLSFPSYSHENDDHVNVEDDLLLPDFKNNRETKQPRP